jgi:hypothetical protein
MKVSQVKGVAVGCYADCISFYEAIETLIASGLDFADLGFLAGEQTVAQQFGDFYVEPQNSSDCLADSCKPALVVNRLMGDSVHAVLGDLFAVGTSRAAGRILSSIPFPDGLRLSRHYDLDDIEMLCATRASPSRPSYAGDLERQLDIGRSLLFLRASETDERPDALSVLWKHTGHGTGIDQNGARSFGIVVPA